MGAAPRDAFARYPGRLAFGEEERAYRKELRAFLDGQPAPRFDHRDYERSVRAVLGWHGQLAAAGFPVPDCPADFGGRDRTLGMGLVQAEEMARAGATFSVNIVGISMVTPLLMALGLPAQQQRYLPAIVRGDELWCQLFSEPDAGSDLFALRTALRCISCVNDDIVEEHLAVRRPAGRTGLTLGAERLLGLPRS
jgi:alkylation response protein AidB-like acyl-CoA dehydrogenase